MTLAQARVGARLRVVSRREGRACGARLAGAGLIIGEEIVVLRLAPFQGPVLVEVPLSGIHLALGRDLADALLVEPADPAGPAP